MSKLVYAAITSLDGYYADETGNFDWGAPDDELFSFITDLEKGIGTALYGRRMYETMVYWETVDASNEEDPSALIFAKLWREQDKIVYSTTLRHPSSDRTVIRPSFVPDEVAALKQSSTRDLSIGGPHIASQAFEARLVDEMHLFVVPVTIGGGLATLPGNELLDLTLVDVRRFGGGAVHLHYGIKNAQ